MHIGIFGGILRAMFNLIASTFAILFWLIQHAA